MAGYSGTPLNRKLGVCEGCRLRPGNAPSNYDELLSPLPDGVTVSPRLQSNVDICHFFTRSENQLRKELPRLVRRIRQDGAIWISWPKRASGVPTDVTEDKIRKVALPLGLVDIKVCAVDDTWSGLKLVIRRALRR